MSSLFAAGSAEAKSTAIDDLGRPHPHFIVGREGGRNSTEAGERSAQTRERRRPRLRNVERRSAQRVKEVDHDELGFCGSVVPHPPRYSSIPFNPGSTLFLRRPS